MYYRRAYVNDSTDAAQKKVVLVKNYINATNVRDMFDGWRDSVADGFPGGKRPDFVMGKFLIGTIK